MKHLFTGVSILLILAVLCFACGAICAHMVDTTWTIASCALEKSGHERLNAVGSAIVYWNKCSPWLLAMQFHDQIDDVRLELEAIEQCILNGLEEELRARTAELKILLARIKDANTLKLSEIL